MSGKTLLLRQMQQICRDSMQTSRFQRNKASGPPFSVETTPTVGVDLDTLVYKKEKVSLREVGGAMIPMWKAYFKTSDFLLYVMDVSSATQLNAAVIELLNALSAAEWIDKPVLVVLNKMYVSTSDV